MTDFKKIDGIATVSARKLASEMAISYDELLEQLDELSRLPHSELANHITTDGDARNIFINKQGFVFVNQHIDLQNAYRINFDSESIFKGFRDLENPVLPYQHTGEVQTKDERMIKLAADIDLNVQLAIHYGEQQIIHYAKAGDILRQAKAELPHGAYIPWIEQNTKVSRQQAANYVRLVETFPELLANGSSDLHLLNMSQALAIATAAPEEQREELKQAVILELEHGKTVTKDDIKKMQITALANQQKLDDLEQEMSDTQSQLIEAEHSVESLQAELDEKEKELEALIQEGGVDTIIQQKTAELRQIIAEMQVKQDAQTDKITTLTKEIDEKVKQKLDIERMKHTKEFSALEDKKRLAQSELETIESKIKQRQSLDAFNSQFQQAAAQLLEKVLSADLLINTTDTQGRLFDHKTIKILVETANKCKAIAEKLDSLATAKQTELDDWLNIDLAEDKPVAKYYYLTEQKPQGVTITAKFEDKDDKKTGLANFKKAVKKSNPVTVSGYRSANDQALGDIYDHSGDRYWQGDFV
jgi:hypothetical protein